MAVFPVKVLLADRTTVPEVLLVRLAEPPRMALTLPLWRLKVAAVVLNVPEVPVRLPAVSVRLPTVSSKVVMLRVPPLTVTAAVLRSVLVAPRARVPLLTVVPPSKVFVPARVWVSAPFMVSDTPEPERLPL